MTSLEFWTEWVPLGVAWLAIALGICGLIILPQALWIIAKNLWKDFRR